MSNLPVPVAARYKAWICGRSLAGIVGSNPSMGHICLSVVSVVCCQVQVSATGRSLVQGSPTECVCIFIRVTRCNNKPLHLQWSVRCGQSKKEERKEEIKRKKAYQILESSLKPQHWYQKYTSSLEQRQMLVRLFSRLGVTYFCGGRRGAHKVLVYKPEGKRSPGSPRRRCEDSNYFSWCGTLVHIFRMILKSRTTKETLSPFCTLKLEAVYYVET